MSGLGIHFLSPAQSQPTLHDPVDYPDKIDTEEKEPYARQRGNGADCAPKEAEPEGPDLPPEVGGKPGALNIFSFEIIDNDSRDDRDAEDKGACLEGVDDRRDRLCLLERVCRGRSSLTLCFITVHRTVLREHYNVFSFFETGDVSLPSTILNLPTLSHLHVCGTIEEQRRQTEMKATAQKISPEDYILSVLSPEDRLERRSRKPSVPLKSLYLLISSENIVKFLSPSKPMAG